MPETVWYSRSSTSALGGLRRRARQLNLHVKRRQRRFHWGRWGCRPLCRTAQTIEREQAERGGKVFVDSTRVGGATVIAAYSPRDRPGVPVSFPVAWDDLDDITPADFTVHTALRQLGDRDPWREHMPDPQPLPPDLIEEGHAVPVARVQAMHEGKRRARAARDEGIA